MVCLSPPLELNRHGEEIGWVGGFHVRKFMATQWNFLRNKMEREEAEMTRNHQHDMYDVPTDKKWSWDTIRWNSRKQKRDLVTSFESRAKLHLDCEHNRITTIVLEKLTEELKAPFSTMTTNSSKNEVCDKDKLEFNAQELRDKLEEINMENGGESCLRFLVPRRMIDWIIRYQRLNESLVLGDLEG